MTSKINKFVVTQKANTILFLGYHYLKYYEANFTNKTIKESSLNIIPMKYEKESNFIDMEFVPSANPKSNNDMFVLITDNNSIFIFEKNILKYKLFNQFSESPTEEKDYDSIFSDSLEIGELSDRENINRQEDNLRIRSKGTNAKENKDSQNEDQKVNVYQKRIQLMRESRTDTFRNIDGNNFINENGNQGIKFQKLIVTQKGFVIGTTQGYALYYEFKNDSEPKIENKIHFSNKLQGIASMSLSQCGGTQDDYMIAVTGIYEKKVQSTNKNNHYQDQEKHSSQLNKRKLMLKRASSLMKAPPSQIIQDELVSYSTELLVLNMKSIVTQQINKIVEKIFQKGAHDGSIFQIADCRNRSMFYTISKDQTIKVWSHTNEWRSIASYNLDEQPLCIDIHPSAFQIAVGFKSGLKIYQNLDKEIRLSFEKLGKAALSVAYSDGGNLLACTNAVYIDIIDPIRMQVIMTLFGHKGLVQHLQWTSHGNYLISTCSNGSLFFWKGNFKELVQKNQDSDVIPISQMNDKNYQYQAIAFDEDLDAVIGLTTTSTLRIFINQGQDPLYEENLLISQNQQEQTILTQHSYKATCMSFSKHLSVIVVGFSNGNISIIQWPIIPNKKNFRYDIFLQSSAITDVKFSTVSRYIIVATDDGNFYVLETFRITDGIEKTWTHENQDRLQLQKKRETNGLSGFSVLDNVVICNREVLQNVNRKIEKLRTTKKTQEINHEIKKKQTEKKYDKQILNIEKEVIEELQKQNRLFDTTMVEFTKEKENLQFILKDQEKEHALETKVLVDNKEKNLNFVQNENDELETRILRLKETIIVELEKIEDEHQQAVNDLIKTYEDSVKLAQDEVKSTIEKLKQNGAYYENMITLQEKDYEQEVQKLQNDLTVEHTNFLNRKNDLQNRNNDLKDEFQNLEDLFKMKNNQKKDKLQEVKEMQGDFKTQTINVERLHEKEMQSNIFIEDKEYSIFNTILEKKQLENLIVFLSEKINELKNERKPLEQRKAELQGLIEDTYREIQDDFLFRKYLELREQSLVKQMKTIYKEIIEKTDLKDSIEVKNNIFKRELQYLAEAKNMKGWIHKMNGMLKCMQEVYNSITAEEVKKISVAFIHIAEVMESNARPYRESVEDNYAKQLKLNENELTYYRNKNSEKLREQQFRYKTLLGQMEKQIKKLRLDNIKLIEEFNILVNEKKKLNNLRKMIKESIKEFLGDKYDEQKYNSSDEDGQKRGGNKNKKKKRNESETGSQQYQSQNAWQQNTLTKSKSSSQFVDKHSKILNTNLTAREPQQSTQFLSQLPDLRRQQVGLVNFGGSQTQRDKSEGKGVMTGFSMNKNQQLMSKRRIINSVTGHINKKGQDGSRYLEKIVQEFEKNKKQIEEQTKNLQKIQALAEVHMNESSEQTSAPTTNQIPLLNLQRLQPNYDISQAKNLHPKQTITTRIPNTSERTKISILDSQSIPITTKRNIPIINNKSNYSTFKDDATLNSQNEQSK